MRLLILAALVLAGCRSSKPPAANCQLVTEKWGPAGTVAVRAEEVASGLEVPVGPRVPPRWITAGHGTAGAHPPH